MSPNDLDDRIARARATSERPSASADGGADPGVGQALGFGLSAGAQLVSAVVLGGGLGWLIDRWLGTRPFAMLILMALMFVAAVMNVWRTMSRAADVATEAALAAERTAKAEDGMTEEIDGKSS